MERTRTARALHERVATIRYERRKTRLELALVGLCGTLACRHRCRRSMKKRSAMRATPQTGEAQANTSAPLKTVANRARVSMGSGRRRDAQVILAGTITDSLTNRFINRGPFPGPRAALPALSNPSWESRRLSSRLPPAAALPPPVGAMERLLARRDQTIAPSDSRAAG